MKHLLKLSSLLLCCSLLLVSISKGQIGLSIYMSDCSLQKFISQKLADKNFSEYSALSVISYHVPISDHKWSSEADLAAIASLSDAEGYEGEFVVLFDCEGKILSAVSISENKPGITTQLKNALPGKVTNIRGYVQNPSVQFYTNITISISSNSISVL